MKIITSPAKLMQVQHSGNALRSTTPHFIDDAATLMKELKSKPPRFLMDLMQISPKLADENWERNQAWRPHPHEKNSAQALYAFTGEVYRGLKAETLSEEAVKYLQKNHRILSGLYGMLKPSDRIMLYRLEMGRKFGGPSWKNLYDFWKEKVTSQLNSEMKKGELLLNLASNEYFKVLDIKNLKAKVMDVDFYEFRDGGLKNIVVYTKHARGMLTRFCAETQAKTLADVMAFSNENYLLDEKLSSDSKLVFVR